MSRAKPSEDLIDGLTKTAAAISAHFKISCSKHSLVHWKKKNPPFPSATEQGRYNRKDCFDWVQTHIISGLDSKQSDMELLRQEMIAKARTNIRKDESSQFDLDVKKGKFIDLKEARQIYGGSLRMYHDWVKAELETNSPIARKNKLTSLGATPEIVAAFYEFDILQAQASIGRIEAKCETASKVVAKAKE